MVHSHSAFFCLAYFFVRPSSLTKKTPSVSSCFARFSAARKSSADKGENQRFFPAAIWQCNPLHLASKMVGQTFPLHSLFGKSEEQFKVSLQRVTLNYYILPCQYGLHQNHSLPCLTDCKPSAAFAFFAVLSPMPAASIRFITSFCGTGSLPTN